MLGDFVARFGPHCGAAVASFIAPIVFRVTPVLPADVAVWPVALSAGALPAICVVCSHVLGLFGPLLCRYATPPSLPRAAGIWIAVMCGSNVGSCCRFSRDGTSGLGCCRLRPGGVPLCSPAAPFLFVLNSPWLVGVRRRTQNCRLPGLCRVGHQGVFCCESASLLPLQWSKQQQNGIADVTCSSALQVAWWLSPRVPCGGHQFSMYVCVCVLRLVCAILI